MKKKLLLLLFVSWLSGPILWGQEVPAFFVKNPDLHPANYVWETSGDLYQNPEVLAALEDAYQKVRSLQQRSDAFFSNQPHLKKVVFFIHDSQEHLGRFEAGFRGDWDQDGSITPVDVNLKRIHDSYSEIFRLWKIFQNARDWPDIGSFRELGFIPPYLISQVLEELDSGPYTSLKEPFVRAVQLNRHAVSLHEILREVVDLYIAFEEVFVEHFHFVPGREHLPLFHDQSSALGPAPAIHQFLSEMLPDSESHWWKPFLAPFFDFLWKPLGVYEKLRRIVERMYEIKSDEVLWHWLSDPGNSLYDDHPILGSPTELVFANDRFETQVPLEALIQVSRVKCWNNCAKRMLLNPRGMTEVQAYPDLDDPAVGRMGTPSDQLVMLDHTTRLLRAIEQSDGGKKSILSCWIKASKKFELESFQALATCLRKNKSLKMRDPQYLLETHYSLERQFWSIQDRLFGMTPDIVWEWNDELGFRLSQLMEERESEVLAMPEGRARLESFAQSRKEYEVFEQKSEIGLSLMSIDEIEKLGIFSDKELEEFRKLRRVFLQNFRKVNDHVTNSDAISEVVEALRFLRDEGVSKLFYLESYRRKQEGYQWLLQRAREDQLESGVRLDTMGLGMVTRFDLNYDGEVDQQDRRFLESVLPLWSVWKK